MIYWHVRRKQYPYGHTWNSNRKLEDLGFTWTLVGKIAHCESTNTIWPLHWYLFHCGFWTGKSKPNSISRMKITNSYRALARKQLNFVRIWSRGAVRWRTANTIFSSLFSQIFNFEAITKILSFQWKLHCKNCTNVILKTAKFLIIWIAMKSREGERKKYTKIRENPIKILFILMQTICFGRCICAEFVGSKTLTNVR